MFREIEKKKNIETQTKSKQSTWTKTLKYNHWNLEEHKTEQGGFTEGEREKTWSPGQRSELMNWLRVSVVLGLCLDGFFSQPCLTREIMRWATPLEFDIKAGSQKKSRKWSYVGSERWVRRVDEGNGGVKLLLKPERSQKNKSSNGLKFDVTIHCTGFHIVESNNQNAIKLCFWKLTRKPVLNFHSYISSFWETSFGNNDRKQRQTKCNSVGPWNLSDSN